MKTNKAAKRLSSDRKKKTPFSRVTKVMRDIILTAAARELGGDAIDEMRDQLGNVFSDIEVEEQASDTTEEE